MPVARVAIEQNMVMCQRQIRMWGDSGRVAGLGVDWAMEPVGSG